MRMLPRRASARPCAETLSIVISRWQGAPRSLRLAVVVVVIFLGYGTAVHVVHLVSNGFSPYPGLPNWLRVHFALLVLLDPLAAVLLARHTRSGVVLAVMVFVSDAVANGYAD